MTRVTLGKSRMRESRTSGSVRAKAEWLSYSTMTTVFFSVFFLTCLFIRYQLNLNHRFL